MLALRSDVSLQGLRRLLAEQLLVLASESAEFEKAMLSCNVLDHHIGGTLRQRSMDIAESLAAQEGDRRHAENIHECAMQPSWVHGEKLAQFGDVDRPVPSRSEIDLPLIHQLHLCLLLQLLPSIRDSVEQRRGQHLQ